MNRFNRNPQFNILRKLGKLLPLVLGIAVVAVFLFGVNFVSRSSYEGQLESLQNAISRDVAQCYAVEGTYPSDIEYLRKNYGLAYDTNRYMVYYDTFGMNIVPEIYVTEVEADA